MSYCALWIDHKHAFVYKFDINGVEETKYEAEHHEHHKHDDHELKKKVYNKFYHSLCDKLSDAKELMIMGPGTAKDEFKHHCEDHHHNSLAKAIVGVESMTSNPTKAMILENAHRFFDSYHLWTKNY